MSQWKKPTLQITQPILVQYRQDGDGDFVATAFDAKYEVIDPELKQALIALQEYMELDFIDLARFAREGKLTAGARALHERLSAHFKEL
jgi:hypothetical protein